MVICFMITKLVRFHELHLKYKSFSKGFWNISIRAVLHNERAEIRNRCAARKLKVQTLEINYLRTFIAANNVTFNNVVV